MTTTDSSLDGLPLVMAIETSCDETAVAIVAGAYRLIASEVASQISLHQPFGGVVPEVASRSHLTQLKPLIGRALDSAGIPIERIDMFAATSGPGLATSLMLGTAVAKGLSVGLRKPYLAVNHLEGHLLSPFFGAGNDVEPCIALVVSGGHTLLVKLDEVGKYEVLGRTRDDAAGEAFDKVGKLLQLPYPAGPHIDRLAVGGDRKRYDFPRSMLHSGDFNFSFSGLKTSVRYMLPKLEGASIHDICASFQEAIVDVLVLKTIAAAQAENRRVIAISGGVSCNSRLRERFQQACDETGIRLLLAAPALCTDNAAMIAAVAAQKFTRGESSSLATDIDPNLKLV
ncbi:MAG: tRNA (adenosine(37)-N6)-threonylcarbamoyltransferase complex transferase subunit TsaD [Chthoniobacteraceae bacterium]